MEEEHRGKGRREGTLGSLVLLPVCLVPIIVFGRRTRKASRAAQQHQASLVSVLHEALTGWRVMVGGSRTVKTASALIAEPAEFVTMTV